MAVGNAVGSNIFNILMVLGIAQKAGFFVNADFYSDFPSFDSGTSVVYWKITEKSKQICFSIILQYYRF